MIGIYKITNSINGHSYIGQSIDIQTRWNHHRNYQNENYDYPLYRAFRKYGIDKFTFEILEECPKDSLDERECYYIQLYDSYNNGYNQTLGGAGNSGNVIKISISDLEEIYDLLLHSSLTQREIARQFNLGEDTISEINQGKTRYNKNFTYPLRNNRKDKNFCIDCGIEILSSATRCAKCHSVASRIVSGRPSREELKALIRNIPFTQIGKQYGVSDNAIRKWCVSENLPSKKSEINKFSDTEWQQL